MKGRNMERNANATEALLLYVPASRTPTECFKEPFTDAATASSIFLEDSRWAGL